MQGIHHFAGVRLRVTGSGVLRTSLSSLDATNTFTLPTITMASTTDIEPFKLANFTNQRAQLIITTTAKDETFVISKITVFAKPLFNEFPS